MRVAVHIDGVGDLLVELVTDELAGVVDVPLLEEAGHWIERPVELLEFASRKAAGVGVALHFVLATEYLALEVAGGEDSDGGVAPREE